METRNKRTLGNIVFALFGMAFFAIIYMTQCVGDANAQTTPPALAVDDYMVHFGEDGSEKWYKIADGDTIELTGKPAHLVEKPMDINGQAVEAQNLKDIELPNGAPTLDWLLNTENGIFAGILTLLMYLSSFIPGLGNMPDKRKRAVALGIFLLLAVTVWRVFDSQVTVANFIGSLVTFFNVQLLYIFGLKPLGLKTPDAKTTT